MPTLGQINTLKVVEKVADGVYLDGGELDALFLPRREVPEGTEEGADLAVFLYLGVADEIIATTKTPHAVVGECAMLKVLSVGKFGAFLDWGIDKDLLLPHSEQAYPLEEGHSYVVYVFEDERSGRIAATTKMHFHLDESSGPFKVGDQVELLIAARSELGYKAVINGEYLGLVYDSDLNQPLNFGEKMKGWIKAVRDDGKVDLSIHTLDKETRSELEQAILNKLEKSDGTLALSDKSSPEEIFKLFKVSKKNFKRAIGGLYKKQLIGIQADSITLGRDESSKPTPKPRYKPEAQDKAKPASSETTQPKQSPYGKSASKKTFVKAKTKELSPGVYRKKLSLNKAEDQPDPSAMAKSRPSEPVPVANSPYKKTETKSSVPEHKNAHIYKKRT